ncbi:MAG: OmpA family protein [Opitutales bacterium]
MNFPFKILTLFFLAATIAFLSACQQRPGHDPSLTVMGPGPGEMEMNYQYLDDDQFGEDGLGLYDREDGNGMGFLGDYDQMANIVAPIYFEFDRSSINSSERSKAEEAARHLADNPNQSLLLEGHCDWRGTTEYNLGLGDRRATRVKDYLVDLGADTSRIEVLSKGDLEAIDGGSEEEMRRDRRVDFIFLQ